MNFEPTAYNAEEKIWSGPADKPLSAGPNISYGQLLIDRLDQHGSKLIQLNHDTGYKMSAREMRLKALRIAASLTELGIGTGDIVQIILGEHDNLVPLWLGIVAAGAAMNPLHISFTERKCDFTMWRWMLLTAEFVLYIIYSYR